MKGRAAIAAEAVTPAADVVIPDIPKSESVLRLLETATKDNLLFDMLPTQSKQAIFNSMTPLDCPEGTDIIVQGDKDARTFYVLERGSCDVYIKVGNNPADGMKKVHQYSAASGFGELALLYSAPRAATVRASSPCKLWVMDRAVYNVIKMEATQSTAAHKRKLLNAVPLLSVLSQEHRDLLADALDTLEFQDGQPIFRQGEIGSQFYIVKSGKVLVIKGPDTKLLAELKEGQFFGERSLIRDDPRAADVIAKGKVSMYVLTRKAFEGLLGPYEEMWKFEVLRKVPILFALSEAQLFELARCMTSHRLKAGQTVFRQGDPGDVFYVIEDGTFTIFKVEGQELARVSKGSCFGELALLRQDKRAATVKAVTDAQVLALHRDDFNKLLGNLADIRHVWRFEALHKVPLLAPLTTAQRSQLCPAMKQIHVPADTTIVKRGEPGDTFCIVESGTCSVVGDNGQEVAKLGPTMWFGESSLLKREPRPNNVVSETAVDLLLLDRSDLTTILGPLQTILDAQAANFGPTSVKKKVGLADLQKIKVLGQGAFGQVMLVKHAQQHYALKILSKQQIITQGLQDHVKREAQIMMECDFPFLVNLVASFKDAERVYLLLECVMGGEFFTYLQTRTAPLGEEQARFYAASVVLGLEYLQDRKILWRDLKPENLLLGIDGYLKLADFGFAKKLAANQKTYTLCGTPEYLAPELVSQSGHTAAVDWWAVGVLIFEMVAGSPPFYMEDRVAMFKRITRVKYACPPNFSPALQDLVKQLLMHNPLQRLGMQKGGASDVKAHPWFAGFDWDAFAAKKLKAPHIPRITSPEDTRNFAQRADFDEHPAVAGGRTRYVSTGVFSDF